MLRQSILLFLLSAAPALAETRELTQSDLRDAVSAKRAMPSRNVMQGVEDFTGGTVLEIRAFENMGDVTFRVLFREASGAVGALMVDGKSGRAVMPQSDTGQSIAQYLAQRPNDWAGRPQPARANGNAGGNGNGNSGGNGNGNSGGNGNGNSGGNGNGNSGGNGNGNSGGNGKSGRNGN